MLRSIYGLPSYFHIKCKIINSIDFNIIEMNSLDRIPFLLLCVLVAHTQHTSQQYRLVK